MSVYDCNEFIIRIATEGGSHIWEYDNGSMIDNWIKYGFDKGFLELIDANHYRNKRQHRRIVKITPEGLLLAEYLSL